MNKIEIKLKELREEYKKAKTDVDRQLIEARAVLVKRSQKNRPFAKVVQKQLY